MIRKLDNQGDTIVEVLIAIAVVSMMLGGAFVAASRSLTTSQQSQDRSQATKILETQLERLKSIAADSSKAIFSTTTSAVFCIDGSLNRQNFTVSSVPSLTADNLSATPGGSYPAPCIVDSGSNTFSGASQSTAYYVSLERASSDSNKFTAHVRWFRAGGGTGSAGREEAKMVYRLYE